MHSTPWAIKLVLNGLLAAFFLSHFVMGDSRPQIPNILFIMTDDQDLLMDSMNFMPKLHNLLARNGVTFSKHYCTSALCCPSRTNILTGKCVHNTNVTDVKPPYGAYSQFVKEGWNDNYLPLWLRDGGINTYYVGKLTNGHSITNYQDPVARGWTSSHFLLDPGMYDYTNTTWTLNNQNWTNHLGVNSIDITTKHAVSMLKTALQGKAPWFMTVAPAVPHVGINASGNGQTFFPIPQAKWANAFSDEVVPRTPNWNSPIQESGASWILNLPLQNATVVDGLDRLYRERIRCVAGIDDMVVDLISVLDRNNALENTHIIFTSDNGFHIGQHRMGPGKKAGFETDINVPLIWRGPGVPPGQVSAAVSTHTDLAPTFLYLFDMPQESGLDGQIIPLLSEQSLNKGSEHVNIELWGEANPYEVEPFTGIKILGEHNNTYKGLRIVADEYSFYYSVWCTNEHELYNMLEDEYQINNLLPKTLDVKTVTGAPVLGRNLGQVVQRLDALMMVLKTCSGKECVYPWKELHPQGDVQTLQQALNPKYDGFYYSQPKVSFSACKLGYLPEYEGPQTALKYQWN